MQLIVRLCLAAIGVLYIGLAIWCSVSPSHTSSKVGFRLEGDTGANEFMTVYGGLEFALGVLFVIPLLQPDVTRWSLLLCLVVHGSLVLFRSIALFVYSDVQPMTIRLAIGEWVILIATGVLLYLHQSADSAPTT
ncbi:MAG: membrane protein [Fuerstiella sp.]